MTTFFVKPEEWRVQRKKSGEGKCRALVGEGVSVGSGLECGRARSRNPAGGIPAPEGWPATG